MKISAQYLAGVADSDGSFSFGRKYNKQRAKDYFVASFQLTWKRTLESKNVFDELVKIYGGSYFDHFTHTSFGRVRILKYCATGRALVKICNDVLPHLLLKKAHAWIALQGAELKSRQWGRGGKPDSIWKRELELYLRMNKLNTKNKKI